VNPQTGLLISKITSLGFSLLVVISTFFVWIYSSRIQNENNSKIDDLIEGKDELLTQNKELILKIDEYQTENNRLNEIINQLKKDSFDVFPAPKDGIEIHSRESAAGKYYRQALDSYLGGDTDESKEKLEFVLGTVPNHFQSLLLLGIILNEQGKPEDALKCLDKAYEISKDPMILQNIEIIKKFPGKKLRIQIIDLNKKKQDS